MPMIIQTTVKADVDSLYLSRDAGGTLFVDKAFAGASDDNDGLSATSPKLTISGAILGAGSGWTIRVAPGNYVENIVIPSGYEGLEIVGRDRLGANRTTIAPLTGIPIEVNSNNVEISHIEVIAATPAVGDPHNTAIYVNGINHRLHDLSVVVSVAGGWGIWLDDADYANVHDCYIDGGYLLNGIGLFIGDDTIGAVIKNNFITKWGSGVNDGGANNGYGIGRHLNAQRTLIAENDIVDNYIGIYYYPPPGATAVEGDAIIHNNFAENTSHDIYDTHIYPDSAINIDSNFFGYSTGAYLWYADNNGDNIGDAIIYCNLNRDRHPLAGPHIWRGVIGMPRHGGLL